MPTYTYRCDECGPMHFWQSITDEVLTICPCGRPITKVFTPPRISVYATPNKGLDARRIDRRESGWDRDMAAYKRLRYEGTQPKGIDGSARLEATCETRDEIELGQPLDAEHREMIADAKSLIIENGGTW